MKKYNIYDLFVVEVQNDNDINYLICKYNKINKTYIEIFTNEKIKVVDDCFVEPLTNYYSLLVKDNYITKKSQMLGKKDLLKKFININSKASLEKGEACSQNEKSIDMNEILEKATLNFFAKEGVWYSHCFNRPKDLDIRNLPCHLRDDLWLAKMLKKNQGLFYISTNSVLQFVKTSTFFQEKRHEYEQRIVKWQINWMKSDGENWIIDENYGGDFCFLTPVCDLAFRKGVVDTLSRIGMSKDAIEEGIEKNADSWRDAFMNRAFRNEYEPLLLNMNFDVFFEGQPKQERKALELANPEFKEKWLKFRKYEYYQRHKDSVDKYGVVEPNMKLSNEEVVKLKAYLKQEHDKRMKQIEQFKQESKISGQSRVLKNNLIK